MNRFLLLILVALLTLGIVFLVKRPEILDQIWLWLLGFAGLIGRFFQEFWGRIKKIFDKEKEERNQASGITTSSESKAINSPKSIVPEDNFKGITLSIIRQTDDGTTTIGMLYLNEEFYGYTLEDSGADATAKAAVQIPAGQYRVEMDHEPNTFAARYQQLYADWYTVPLKLSGVKGFSSVWLQNGVDELPGQASIVVTNTLEVSDQQLFKANSLETFKKIYTKLRSAIEQGTAVRTIVKSDNVKQQNLKAS